MTGFDSVTTGAASLLFGMATVPVTHMLQPIIANRNYLGVRFQRALTAFKGLALAPAFA